MQNVTDWLLKLYTKCLSMLRSEKGQTLVEYALLLVFIAIVVYLMIKGSGRQVNCVYSQINSALGDIN